MHHRLDPHLFVDQPMRLVKLADDDYRVMISKHHAGRIFKTSRGSIGQVWLWTLTGPYCGAVGINTSGDCATLGEARQAFRAVFDRWHAWAIRQNAEVSWHE